MLTDGNFTERYHVTPSYLAFIIIFNTPSLEMGLRGTETWPKLKNSVCMKKHFSEKQLQVPLMQQTIVIWRKI